MDPAQSARVQRRTVATLSAAQVVGGIGNGAAVSVGALLVEDVSDSTAWAGIASTMLTLGAAVSALPLASVASHHGRRPALTLGWLTAVLGGVVVLVGADVGSLVLTLAGMFCCGSNMATNLQSRYAAADLAPPSSTGRSLSIVVWSTTIGAVLGPNLTGPGAGVAQTLALPELAGPFVFSVCAWLGGATVMYLALRPDPLVLARDAGGTARTSQSGGLARSVPIARRTPAALTGIITVACAHAFMIGVMSMTPVHMQHYGAGLTIVGLTISLHIAGMYALSPIMGILADRWGRRRTVLLGQASLLAAAMVAGTAGDSSAQITAGLVLLGLGWSASMISGSALVAASVSVEDRPSVQGLSDLLMNLSAAASGTVAGMVVSGAGFGWLNALAVVLVAPVAWQLLRSTQVRVTMGP